MTVPSLYATPSFYDTTSALSANPFYNPRTCGVSSTLKTMGLGLNPAYGNIGYANRIEGTGDWLSDLGTGLKNVGTNVLGFLAPSVGSAVEQLIGQGRKAALEKLGYQFLEVVQVTYQGKPVNGTKVKKPDGTFAVMLSDGTELPFTADVAKSLQTIDPRTGALSGAATTGLIVGGVALVALLFFMSRRRR